MKIGTKEEMLAMPGVVHIFPTSDPLVWEGHEETEIVDGAVLPIVVTPWQIRKALNAAGLRAAVEAAVAAGTQDMKDGWEFATEVRRDDPLVIAMGAALHKTEKELDDIFALAASL